MYTQGDHYQIKTLKKSFWRRLGPAELRELTQDAQRAGQALKHCFYTIVKIIIPQFTILIFAWQQAKAC